MATSLCDMGKREECEIKVHETEFRQIHGRDGRTGVHEQLCGLDAREFGLPQARERVFTVSVLNGEKI